MAQRGVKGVHLITATATISPRDFRSSSRPLRRCRRDPA
jgi:hypothetical protein